MSATDPLREALSTLIDEIAGPTGRIRLDARDTGTGVEGDADLIAAAITRARAVLAAVPAEPNTTCVQGDDAKSAAEKLAVPAEPEVWEWGTEVKLRPDSQPAFYSAWSLDHAENEAENHHRIGREAWVARRRPGTAPGEWERVDPEPRPPKPPREFWREVPCGHPPDPVAWFNGEAFVCHCGGPLDAAKGQALDGAPGPVVLCQKCGCHVACPEPPLQDGGE